jgi:hypothetical protein
MGRYFRYIITTLAFVLATTPCAQAKDIPSDGMSYEDVAIWLKGRGYQAQIATDSLGNKIVKTTVDGNPFSVYMFDCKNDRCGSIQFAFGPRSQKGGFDLKRLNEWNKVKRWSRAYVNPDLWIEGDFDLTPGGSYELLNDNLDTWLKSMTESKTFFGAK